MALKQETFSSRNSILENCRLQFNINQISTLNIISENNLIFLLFFSFFFLPLLYMIKTASNRKRLLE